MEHIELFRDEFSVSTHPEKLNLTLIHSFLAEKSGWSRGIPISRVQTSIENSLNFGLYYQNNQIGFARVISDYATIAYLGDIFIIDDFRRKGLSKWLMECVLKHPNLQGLRRWILLTSTAKWLYEKYGFTALPKPEIYMEKFDAEVYKKCE